MVWYPFHYNDVAGFRLNEGIDLGTTSDEAAKHFDAWVTGVVMSDPDPNYDGKTSAFDACVQADPNWTTPKIMATYLDCMSNETKMQSKAVKLLEETDPSKLNSWEIGHYNALECAAYGDWNGALKVYDQHLFMYPKDQIAILGAYFLAFYTGQKDQVRAIPARIVKSYSEDDRFYGITHGKMCFGYEETGEIGLAEKEGSIALHHTPKDIWAIHSMAHVMDTKYEAEKGIDFLLSCQDNWDGFDRRGGMVAHVWWHLALFYIEKEDFEAVLTLYDDKMKQFSVKAKDGHESMFLMSDAVSLLLRLQMEQKCPDDLSDRWRELSNFCVSRFSNAVGDNFFYDFHLLIGLLFGEASRDDVTKVTDRIEEASLNKKSWNGRVLRDIGAKVVAGIKSFGAGDYADAVDALASVRHRMTLELYGSVAQQRILHLIMLRAGVLAGPDRRQLAEQLLEEHIASCYQGKRSDVVKRIQEVLVTKGAA